jgi:Uri superfamily endonuclease
MKLSEFTDIDLDVEEKASRKLCKSSKPNSKLGASNLASCKSQGFRRREGKKSHKLGKSKNSRVKVGGKKIKGQKYGGPLPDWS